MLLIIVIRLLLSEFFFKFYWQSKFNDLFCSSPPIFISYNFALLLYALLVHNVLSLVPNNKLQPEIMRPTLMISAWWLILTPLWNSTKRNSKIFRSIKVWEELQTSVDELFKAKYQKREL